MLATIRRTDANRMTDMYTLNFGLHWGQLRFPAVDWAKLSAIELPRGGSVTTDVELVESRWEPTQRVGSKITSGPATEEE